MGNIICIAIQKGGAGKTTTAAAIAQAAAHEGKKVLAVDLDPQGNLTTALAGTASGSGAYGLLEGEPAENLIQRTAQGMDLIPANKNLAAITSAPASARRLQKALEPIKRKYAWIIIDTPPTAGELQYNALQAASGLVIPLEADPYNLQALYQIIETAKQIQQTNIELKIAGYILTQFNQRSTISKKMSALIMQEGAKNGVPYLGSVRPAVVVKEVAALRVSLFDYAPNSRPAEDYMGIYKTLVKAMRKK